MKRKSKLMLLLLIGFFAVSAAIFLLRYRHPNSSSHDSQEVHMPTETSAPKATSFPASQPGLFHENTSEISNYQSGGAYDNTSIIGCDLGFGIHLTLGIGSQTAFDRIYLNPVLTYDYAMNTSEPYGFLVRATRGAVVYSGEPKPIDYDQNRGERSLFIAGRTYDKLVPAHYNNEAQYGVAWVNDIEGDSMDRTGTELLIHAIRLKDGRLMGAAKAQIIFDQESDAYLLASVSSSDVSVAGKLRTEDRKALIDSTVQFFNENCLNVQTSLSEADLKNIRSAIVVEKTNKVLFNRLFNVKAEVIPSGRLRGCDIYAVNLPCAGLGYLTAYYIPIAQAQGISHIAFGDLDYVLVGYDAANCPPFNAETFNSFLLPEEIEKFGID